MQMLTKKRSLMFQIVTALFSLSFSLSFYRLQTASSRKDRERIKPRPQRTANVNQARTKRSVVLTQE